MFHKNKIKIVLFIKNQEYFRNYIESGFDRALSEDYDLSYVIEKNIVSDFIKSRGSQVYFEYETDQRHSKNFLHVSNCLMWFHRKRSKSFLYRAKRNLQYKRFSLSTPLLSNVRNILSVWKKKLIYKLVEIPIVVELVVSYGTRKISFSKDLSRFLDQRGDVIIFPSSAYDYELHALLRQDKNFRSRVFMLADNWDNLSSKTILTKTPDLIGVWGNQSRKHAIEIQQIPAHQVIAIGTARYLKYFTQKGTEQRHFPFKYILFLGTALPFDEYTGLKVLNDTLCSLGDEFKDYKVVYRPHPQGLSSANVKALGRVLIDPQLTSKSIVKGNFPPLDYYPDLIKHSEFIVGGLTTMMIEAAIFHKFFIALAFEELDNYTSQSRALISYKHFEEIEKMEHLDIAHSQDAFRNKVLSTLEKPIKINSYKLDQERRHFCVDCSPCQYLTAVKSGIMQLTDENEVIA
jgi:hypothetical protein